MKFYTALVHKDEGSSYGLTFPDLPGCFAASDTWEDIPALAAEALDLWFEDQPDVEPAPVDEIRNRVEVKEEIEAGASLMSMPYIPADAALTRVNVSIERGLLRAIDETAKARKMTRSSFFAQVARRELVGHA